MCGITGMVDLKNFVRGKRDTFFEMTKSLTSGGTANVWFSTFVGFGYKGAEDHDQLMQKKANGSMYAIVFSGFLNNAKELQHRLLKKGHLFQTLTAAEIAITAYIEWLEECVDELVGNFVFAIWDDAKQQLFIARSPTVEKQLFYCRDSTFFLFSTEIDPIVNYQKEGPRKIEELLAGQSLILANGIPKIKN